VPAYLASIKAVVVLSQCFIVAFCIIPYFAADVNCIHVFDTIGLTPLGVLSWNKVIFRSFAGLLGFFE